MRSRIAIGALCVAVVLLVWFVIGRQPSHAGVTIGVLLPTTGTNASIGKPALNGIQLAVNQANRMRPPGDQINIKVEDTAADPSVAIQAFHKLSDFIHPVAIIGPLTSGESVSLLPWLPKYGIPIVSPGASSASLDHKKDLFFRVELSDRIGGQKQAEIAARQLGSRNISILYISNEYGQGLASVLKTKFESFGGTVVDSIPFPAGTTDFRPILMRIARSKADMIIPIGIDELVNIIQQARQLNVRQTIFTTPIFGNQNYLQQLGEGAEGVYFVYYGSFDIDSHDRIAQTFLNAYKGAYGENPTYYSALGYDAAEEIIHAIEASGKYPNRDTITRELQSGGTLHGVTGDLVMDEYGDVDKPVALKRVVQQKFVLVDSVTAQTTEAN